MTLSKDEGKNVTAVYSMIFDVFKIWFKSASIVYRSTTFLITKL